MNDAATSDTEDEGKDTSKVNSTLNSSKDSSDDIDVSKLSKSARRRLKKKLAQQGQHTQVNGIDKSKVKYL